MHAPGVQVPLSNDVVGYEVVYWPTANSSYLAVAVVGVRTEEATVQHLRPYTRYLLAVRLRCRGGGVGLASPTVSFTTEAAGELSSRL